MLKYLIVSFALLILFISCDGPSVALCGPITITERHFTSVYKPVDIPFFAMLMFPEGKRKTVFRRDSVVISAFVPAGLDVQSIGVSVIYKSLDSLFTGFENDSLSARYDSLEKVASNKAQFQDSVWNMAFIQYLPKMKESDRAPEYDTFLANVLDTGHTGRQFQSYKCYLPIEIPPSMKSTDITIVGRIRLMPKAPGKFKVGYFMSLDNMNVWKDMRDTRKNLDTVLTSFGDYDTVTVTGMGITLNSKNTGELNPFQLSAAPNPMAGVQGGVISFLTQSKSATVSMYDVTGRPIFTEPVTGQTGIRKYLISQLTRRPLVAGQYVLRLTADGKSVTRPITVIK